MGALNYKTRRNRRHRLAAELYATWTPRRLFTFGTSVGGAHWFDSPSLYPGGNHLYLYKDSAGTTPVTAVGDTIGLSLDRAFGGMRGPELVTNPGGPFTSTTGFTHGSVVVSVDAGELVLESMDGTSDRAELVLSGLVVGKTYEFTAEAYSTPGAGAAMFTAWTWATIPDTSITAGVWKKYRLIVQATATSGFCRVYAANSGGAPGDAVRLRSFSIREIPGTHLIQATGTARPTLSARVNGLVGTEGAFSGASWTKVGSPTITLTAGAGPRGESADLISNLNTLGVGTIYFFNANFSTALSGASVGSSYVPRIQIKRVSTSGTVTITNPSTPANGQWNINLALLSDSWEVITATHAAVTVVAPFSVAIAGQAGILFTASATGVQFYCTQADVRIADDAAKNIPAYQRVGATAADHDTDGFPHGQYPDGTDDNQTTTTGGGGTTGFFYCGAITVSGGAGTARTIWSDTGTNTGYRVRINSSNKLELAAGNGSAYTTVASNETITAPGTYILSAWDDGGVLAVQVNNFAAATTTRPSVSAGTSTVTMYKDNGAASSYLNGRDYGSVYRQTYPGETMHARLKSWLARQARITI